MNHDLTRRDFVVPIEKYDPATGILTGVISSSALDAWNESIDQDGMKIRSSVPLLWGHRHDQPIGRAISFQRDGDRTRATFELSKTDPTAQRIRGLAAEGIVTQLSVGLVPRKWENNILRESELVEVSVVAVGANPDARIEIVRESPSQQHQEIVMDRTGTVRVAGNTRVAAPAIITRNAAQERWSLARFMAMVLEDRDGPDYGFAAEIHQEICPRNGAPRHGGFLLPMPRLLERAIGAAHSDAGRR